MSRRPQHERGFTLVEVLAALLVFSFAIIGLTHAGTQSTQAVSVISEKSLAGIVADNALVQSRLRPVKLGTQTNTVEQMGQTFSYTVTTAKTQVTDFYSLEVSVKKESQQQVLISRQAFRSAQ